jgi:hypothetical protein
MRNDLNPWNTPLLVYVFFEIHQRVGVIHTAIEEVDLLES